MATVTERIRRGWSAFVGRDQSYNFEAGYAFRPDRMMYKTYTARSVMASIQNRIAVDFSSVVFNHVLTDDDGNLKDVINGPLNEILSLSPNIDQTSAAFFLDAAMVMFNEGYVVLAPVETDVDPALTDSYKIKSVRIGRITEWYPSKIRFEAYNEKTGLKQEIVMLKRNVCIIENPFYAIMNEPNSLLQRLLRLLNQIDRTNEQNSSGKLDLILQFPYVVRGAAKRKEAESRRRDIEDQLQGAQYGIAYIDGTEKITQLNRPVENSLWSQAKDLQDQLYNQLGLTKSIFDGTADEAALLNYHNRTIEVIANVFCLEMQRKWLSKTARAQHQAIQFHRDPFKLVPVGQIADIADKFTRNEILTSNEIRSIVGRRPSKDPKADQLINSNLNHAKEDSEGASSGKTSISQLSATSKATTDSRRIQNAKNWLNQIGTLSTGKVE